LGQDNLESESPRIDTDALLEFMFRLGQALLVCGEQTANVELMLRRTASAYGVRRSRVVTFPTAIFISLHDRVEERVTLAEGPGHTLRLDQSADVYELGETAQCGAVVPGEGLARLAEILRKRCTSLCGTGARSPLRVARSSSGVLRRSTFVASRKAEAGPQRR
jgi:uncharacterized membrane protein YjjP (DUF1212 family)